MQWGCLKVQYSMELQLKSYVFLLTPFESAFLHESCDKIWLSSNLRLHRCGILWHFQEKAELRKMQVVVSAAATAFSKDIKEVRKHLREAGQLSSTQ